MRSGACALAISIAVCAFGAGSAHADPLKGTLTVERAAGAEACPDQEALRVEVEQLAGAPILSGSEPRDVSLDLRIAPAPKGGFSAVIRVSGKRTGERQLEDVGPGCDVLARGLVVTLAILLEAGPGAPLPPPEKKPAGPPPVPWWRKYYLLPAIDAPQPVAPTDEGIPPIVASLGALYDSGTLASDAVGASLAVDAYIPYASFGVAFVWLPVEQVDLDSYYVSYAYAAGRIRACARDPFIEQFGLSGCLRLVAGRRTASLVTDGAGTGDQNHGAYLALGTQLEISRRIVGPFGIYADFGLDFPALQDELRVIDPDGDGALDDPDHVVTFDTGIGVRFWLEPARPEKGRP
jgi:hypothetical protein